MTETAFREQFGTSANKRNAFGKRVSGAVADEDDDEARPARAVAADGRLPHDDTRRWRAPHGVLSPSP